MPSNLPPFVKYGKLKSIDLNEISNINHEPFYVFEKVDGGNCQVRNLGSEIMPGSKANFLKKPFLERAEWFRKLNAWARSNPSLFNLDERTVLFGEWIGNHTIDYDPRHLDQFLMIDLFDLNSNRFVDFNLARSYVHSLGVNGLNYAEPIHHGKVTKSLIENLLLENSSLYRGPKEGVVLKNYDSGNRFKIYHPDFSERLRNRDGSIDFLTPMRFRKSIFRLSENTRSGESISPSDVVYSVMQDISAEEGVKVNSYDVSDRLFDHINKGKLHSALRLLNL